FFVLSGFLITGILLDAKSAPRYFRSFFMRRALRIFPLYYGYLAFVFFVWPFLVVPPDDYFSLCAVQPWLWLYGQNLWIALSGAWLPYGTNHLWSLAVEEQFYLVWPFVVRLCGRRTLAWICGLVLPAMLAVRVGLTWAGAEPRTIYVVPWTRLDGFAAGALV